MLYCCNPLCPDPFNFNDVSTCISCGHQSLTPIFHHRYKIIKILGEGGFGKTYQAEDVEQMNHPCVIKQLTFAKPQALQKATALFEQEAKTLYELGKHLQIPSFLAYFEENNKLYLVQEYVEGKNLYTEFLERGKFDEEKIVYLLKNLLPVLLFIHNNKIIHRDIKPENIMRRDGDGQLILIDFGIAKELVGTASYTNGTVIGTPGYAPLEQIAYGQVSPASDLYSLGITCIRLITGEFIRNDLNNSSAKWWEIFSVDFNSKILEILDRLVAIDVGDRYQWAEQVIEDLDAMNPTLNPPSVTRINGRKISTIDQMHEVGGIIGVNHKKLVHIAKASIVSIEEHLEGKRLGNGSGFLYKQVIDPAFKKSRCYFLTNLHAITGIFQWHKHLSNIARAGKNIDDINPEFVIIWNDKEYSIDKFLIPKNTIDKILTIPDYQYLNFAGFDLDIEGDQIIDFFGISPVPQLESGDKVYAFGYSREMNLSIADGIVSHIYEEYREGIDHPITRGAIGHNILINPSNSGGPTVMESGVIVGISTRGYASSVAVGLNFSLSIHSILDRLSDRDNFEILTVSEHLRTVKGIIKKEFHL